MLVIQYQCNGCASIFEQLSSASSELSCLNCGAEEARIGRLLNTYFYPNKTFCPHDKLLDPQQLKTELSDILADDSLRCGGCGVDGAPGRCSTGGCGGSCSCGAGGGCGKKSKRISTAPSFV
jgi:hypothetical protein